MFFWATPALKNRVQLRPQVAGWWLVLMVLSSFRWALQPESACVLQL